MAGSHNTTPMVRDVPRTDIADYGHVPSLLVSQAVDVPNTKEVVEAVGFLDMKVTDPGQRTSP